MISFKNVSKKYGDVTAVDDISFDIESHELFVIIGPSGSGKTTAMKMINRMHEATDGDIYIDDENINSIDPVKLRRRIGYVIQGVGLMPHMTIGENIAIVHRLLGKKLPPDEIDRLLNLVNMNPEDFKDRYPDELSGGQQQRIGVIRALANDPNIILMDEPFSALDPVTRNQLQNEFKKLQKEIDKTIVFVTHDIDEALKLGDRICLMRDGKVEQLGTPDELLHHPKNDFVKQFIGEDKLQAKAFKHFRLKDWMKKEIVVAEEDETVEDVIDLMKEYHVNILPVVNGDLLIGSVSLWSLLGNEGQVINDYIGGDGIVEIDVESSVTGAINRINHFRGAVPVVTNKGKLLGVLDHDNLLSTLSTDASGGVE
ncbi:betaine/proline/choline family ABC transporter ATP-binding protein [Corticicoccus populi]|uniref:Quaternary amine transport ATP-binding protein n=1 Tax=Corticicoccus populi TaxID=1812821 RepID=A0ABW5WZB1_9STAP